MIKYEFLGQGGIPETKAIFKWFWITKCFLMLFIEHDFKLHKQ